MGRLISSGYLFPQRQGSDPASLALRHFAQRVKVRHILVKCFRIAARPFFYPAHGLRGLLRSASSNSPPTGNANAAFQTTRAVQRDSGTVGLGSYLAVPLTAGGGLLSGVKLKKDDQKLTFWGRRSACPCKAAILRRPRGSGHPAQISARRRNAPSCLRLRGHIRRHPADFLAVLAPSAKAPVTYSSPHRRPGRRLW